MLSKLIEKTDIQSWSAITLQVAILAINGILYFKGGVENSFIILSSVIILSLFSLQVVSRRFLMLYPYQGALKQPTPRIDTTILRCFIIFSLFFMLLGILRGRSEFLSIIDTIFSWLLIILVPFLIPTLPLLWHFKFNEKERNLLIEDLKTKPLKYSGECLDPDCKNPVAKYTKTVESQNSCKITINCEKCKKSFACYKPVNIGY